MSEEATQDAGSQEVATQAVAENAAPVNFLDSLPEDLRGNPSLKNFTDAGSLAQAATYVSDLFQNYTRKAFCAIASLQPTFVYWQR